MNWLSHFKTNEKRIVLLFIYSRQINNVIMFNYNMGICSHFKIFPNSFSN